MISTGVQGHLVGAILMKEHDLVGETSRMPDLAPAGTEVTLQVGLGVVLVEGDPVFVAGVNLR